jgi:hypothetical protein
MKDILGNEIKVGDFFAYGMRVGDSGELQIGRVEELSTVKGRYPVDKIKALLLEPNMKTIKEKRSTLNYSNRLVVITPTEAIMKLFSTDCAAIGSKHTWKIAGKGVHKKVCTTCGKDIFHYNPDNDKEKRADESFKKGIENDYIRSMV